MIVILGLLICSFAIFIALYEKKGNKHNLKKRKKGEVEITYLEYILSEENKELFNEVMEANDGKFVNNDSLLKKAFDSEFKKNINERKIPMIQIMRNEALEAFQLWEKKTDKVKY